MLNQNRYEGVAMVGDSPTAGWVFGQTAIHGAAWGGKNSKLNSIANRTLVTPNCSIDVEVIGV